MLLIAMILSGCEKNNQGDCIKAKGELITVKRALPLFNSLEINGDFNIELSDISDNVMSINAQLSVLELIEIEVENYALKISLNGCVINNKPITLKVNGFNLNRIVLNGSGIINPNTSFIGQYMHMEINGSGIIDSKISSVTLDSHIIGTGSMNLHGYVTNHSIEIEGSGEINSFGLNSTFCQISIDGSGDCKVYAEKELKVIIFGSGDVYYKGYPTIDSVIAGSGRIIDAN